MSSPVAEYTPNTSPFAARRKRSFPRYERKEELQHQTHYCPGCGHGIVHKMLARAIDELGIQNRTILISPVGCSVFAYYYFDVGNIQAAHGRAPAVGTAVKRSHPDSILISYQGDGDLSAIGSAEILHAANRGENITAIFVNNAIYSMTGGQCAPTTLLGQKSTTTPNGRNAATEGYPLRVSELLATLEAPVYIARVGLGDNKQIAQADKAIRRAVENQVKGLGFSLIEVLSPCPTIWKMSAVDAQKWVRDVMEKTYPLGVLCDRTADRQPRATPEPAPSLESVPQILGITDGEAARLPITCGRDSITVPGWPNGSNGKHHPKAEPAEKLPRRLRSICASALPALAVRVFCWPAKSWPKRAWMRDWKFRGCPPTARRCAPALRTVTSASRAKPSTRPWSRRPTCCWP